MTVPWSSPNATSIHGSNFLPRANAPSTKRWFMFSPEVGDTITWDVINDAIARSDYQRVDTLLGRIEDFGRGEMTISDYQLDKSSAGLPLDDAYPVNLLSFKFRIVLSWPAGYKAQ